MGWGREGDVADKDAATLATWGSFVGNWEGGPVVVLLGNRKGACVSLMVVRNGAPDLGIEEWSYWLV